jgi:hypothetical protein
MSRLGSLASSEEVYTKTEADAALASQVSVPANLATIATTGAYADLTGKPTIPTVSDATTGAKGIVQLAGDLAGTASAPTVPGLATKEPSIAAGTSAQYWRGDKSWQTLDRSAVGLANVDNTSDANKPLSTATQIALNLKAPLVSPSFTTPALGVATATSVAATGALTSSGTAGIGYAAGAGGTVSQATNKATAVTLNKVCGAITMNTAALAAATIVTFVLNNSTIEANDVIVVNHVSAGTFGAYTVNARATGAGTASVAIRNNSAGSLSEAIVIRFAVVKAVTS